MANNEEKEIRNEEQEPKEEAPDTHTEEYAESENLEVTTEPVEEVPVEAEKEAAAEAAVETATETEAAKEPHKKILQGKVVSNKSDKTIVVLVERYVSHPLYKKYFKRSKKFMAHDPANDCNEGDTVRIKESKPLSKRKRWEMIEIIERAK